MGGGGSLLTSVFHFANYPDLTEALLKARDKNWNNLTVLIKSITKAIHINSKGTKKSSVLQNEMN